MSINSDSKLCIGNFTPGRNSRRHSGLSLHEFTIEPVSSIEYPASTLMTQSCL
jgi:hypothetical protein